MTSSINLGSGRIAHSVGKDARGSRACHDTALRDIARRFLKLPPFPDASPERGADRLAAGDTLKHVAMFPGSQLAGVRYYISGRDRFFAYAAPHQIDDAIRFADACTLSFWRYRQRGAKIPDPGQFNISIEAAEADLEDWKESAPEILKIIQDIETHLLEVEVFIPPREARTAQVVNSVHSKAARRTLRGELRSVGTAMRDALLDTSAAHDKQLEKLFDMMGDLGKRMDAMTDTDLTKTSIQTGGGNFEPVPADSHTAMPADSHTAMPPGENIFELTKGETV